MDLRAEGGFQGGNFALAAAAAEAFLGRPLDRAAVEAAARETLVPGRLEVVGERPLTLHDGAHNPSGASALAESLGDVFAERRPRVAVIGVLEDKDAAAMLETLLPALRHGGVHAPVESARAVAGHARDARREARRAPGRDGRGPARRGGARPRAGRRGRAVLATGSIYLIADLVRENPDARASTL